MLKRTSIARRFTIILFLIFFITFPLLTGAMYFFFRDNAMREISDKALLTMNSMESVRKYVVEEVRPQVRKELPDRFVLEAMSGVYAIRKVATNLGKVQPHYSYKQASLNPRAPENRADYFEEWILKQFEAKGELKQLTGLREDQNEALYYIAKPVRLDRQDCLGCHSDPAIAPASITEKYGTTAAFNYSLNSVLGANIIYVPASVPINIAKRSTLVVGIIFTALYLILFFIINLLIRRSIIAPIERFVQIADQVSKGKFDNEFRIDTEDELKTLAEAFTRLKTSIVMMMDVIKKPKK